jgi:hypothetical protein
MHVAMVPTFSGYHVDSATSEDAVQENLVMAVQQAIAFAELLHQFVAKGLDMTRLWPFTGYAAFIAGSVVVVRCSLYKFWSPKLFFDH